MLSTVCDQGPTNKAAVTQLCAETNQTEDHFYSIINEHHVTIMYDLPHLLKNTRNALFTCNLEMHGGKLAKFQYIQKAFELDQKKKCRMLNKLKPEHFKKGDRYYRMKVGVAAAQLSNHMAGSIEHFVASNELPSEALFTAEFVDRIDNLFDSMNGSTYISSEDKPYRCGVSNASPHFTFWDKLLIEIPKWKLWR